MSSLLRSSTTGSRALLVGLAACTAAGLLVALGHAVVALALVAVALSGGLVILERPRVAPAVWASAAFMAPLQGIRVAPILAVSDVLLVVGVVAILPDVLVGWRRVVPPGVILAFMLLITTGVIGTFFADDVGASMVNLVKIVMAGAGSVVAMALWSPSAQRLRQFAWLWFGGAAISAMWAVVSPRSFVGRSVGFTTHPNHFGLVCALAVGLGLGLAFSTTGRPRMAALAGVALLTGGIGLSGSRAAILALAVTIGVTAVLTRRFRLLVGTGLIVVLAAMAVVVGLVDIPDSHALSRLGGGGGSASSDFERKETLGKALASVNRHPFTGEGFQFAQAAHNIYLQALVVGGPLGLLGFVLVSTLILRAGWRAARAARGRGNGPLLAGLTAGYAGYLVSGAFDNILWDRYLWTYIGLLIVLAADPARPAAASRIVSNPQAVWRPQTAPGR